MAAGVCPQTPGSGRYRVKTGVREAAAQRFGAVYAHLLLCRREVDGSEPLFRPVATGPGGVEVFSWPAVAMPEEWLEEV